MSQDERSQWDPTAPASEAIVALVRSYVVSHLKRRLDAAALAGAAGVGERTLRRAIHDQTGLAVSGFVLRVKLEAAHEWLSSNCESRSIAEICRALGARSPSTISRAYIQRYGERMSQTRQQSVRLGGADRGGASVGADLLDSRFADGGK